MAETKPPKVFISYVWEDDLKTWVLDFATRLRSDGINAILDQWGTVPGDQLTQFMERSVHSSDFVVFICTPTYKRKSDSRRGGVGYEGTIITGEVFSKNNHRKFIPVLRKGKWASAAPSWATSKIYIDFRDDPYSEASYQQLLNTLFGKSPTVPPVRDDTLQEKVERDAAEKAEREAAEKIAREKVEHEVAEKAKRDVAEKSIQEKAKTDKHQEKSIKKGFFGDYFKRKERILEAAIEKRVQVDKPASLFVWIRRQGTKNIIHFIPRIDENIHIDEDNVKNKDIKLEFPVIGGQVYAAGISIKLVAPDFNLVQDQKNIIVPPDDDSVICTFTVIPRKVGDLLLTIEVYKDEVLLGNRSLHTEATMNAPLIAREILIVRVPVDDVLKPKKIDTGIIVALISLVGTIIVGLLGSPLATRWLSPSPITFVPSSATNTFVVNTVTAIHTSQATRTKAPQNSSPSDTSIPPSLTNAPLLPTWTYLPTSTRRPSLPTSTFTPRPPTRTPLSPTLTYTPTDILLSPTFTPTATMTSTAISTATCTSISSTQDVSITQSFPALGHSAEGIIWDGMNLWVTDNSATVFEVDPSGNVLDSFQSPEGTPQGIAWDGSSFWIFTTNRSRIYQVQYTGGQIQILSYFNAPVEVIGGGITNDMAWDGNNLWYVNQFKVYHLTTTGNELSHFVFSKNVTGLDWDGSNLWLAYNDFPNNATLVKVNTDGIVINTYTTPVFEIDSLTCGDGYLWALGLDSLGGNPIIYKLSVPNQ